MRPELTPAALALEKRSCPGLNCRLKDSMDSDLNQTRSDHAVVVELIRKIYAARQAFDLKTLTVQFKAAHARTLRAFRRELRRAQAQAYAHAGLAALGRGQRHLSRLNFYHSLRNRPLKFKTLARLARTFLPLGLARILSGRTVGDARSAENGPLHTSRPEVPREICSVGQQADLDAIARQPMASGESYSAANRSS
jgi:hypothetical protein